MKKMIYAVAFISAIVSFNSCGGSTEEKKELTICDCIEEGKVKQTEECRDLAMDAKVTEIEKCK